MGGDCEAGEGAGVSSGDAIACLARVRHRESNTGQVQRTLSSVTEKTEPNMCKQTADMTSDKPGRVGLGLNFDMISWR